MGEIKKRMIKSSHTVSIILTAALAITAALFLVCAAAAAVSLALPGTLKMEFGFNPFGSAFDTGSSGGTAAAMAMLAWDLAMVSGVFIALLRMFRDIQREASPFVEKNVRRLKTR